MAKTTGACFSLDAKGSLANAITYQHALKSRIVRKIPIPRYQRTEDQDKVRKAVAKAVEHWRNLLLSQQGLWASYTNPKGNTGYPAFIQQFIPRTIDHVFQYQLPPKHGYCIVGEWLVGELITGGVWQDP